MGQYWNQYSNTNQLAKQQEKRDIFEMVRLDIISREEARSMLGLCKDIRPTCPDCKQVMVKTHIELVDGSGWFTGWGCECKYEPENDIPPCSELIRRMQDK